MSLRALPPVWRRVPRVAGNARDAREALSRHFGGENVQLFGSGTQALTVAISEATGRRDPASCNAILPAYACPDVISACIGAGVQPRLVDVGSRLVGYDLASLKTSIDAHTVAVVAIDLLGAGDAVDEVTPIARDAGIALIQDWAQSLPRTPTFKTGSHLVLSFGRGKPLNVLGGGAVIGKIVASYPTQERGGLDMRAGALAVAGFEILTHPSVYGAVEKMAGSRIGSTFYKNPTRPRQISDSAPSRLSVGLGEYIGTPSYQVAPYVRFFTTWHELGITPLSDKFVDARCEPLRLPMLARDRTQRDRVVSRLRADGLGASKMYGASLPQVTGVPDYVAAQGPFYNAASLADRLFTLPTHSRVDDKHAAAMHARILEMGRA